MVIKFKSTLIVMALYVLLLSGFSNSVHAEPGIGQLELTGTIIDVGCDVSTSASQSINLGSFEAGMFSSSGTVTNKQTFNIVLKECSSNIKGSAVSFSGTSDANDATLLALTNSGTQAKGVAIQLLDNTDSPIAINSTTSVYPLNAGDNSLQFGLRYKSTLASVVAGDANAVLYFDMNYQ